MSPLSRFGLLALASLALASASQAAAPLRAPAIFVTENYALTFRAPPGSTYCPLPEDFTGSDHGTIVFLEPPQTCGGAGYPSIARGFAPESTPRINVYYGYWLGEEISPRRPCNQFGRVHFMGKARPLCTVTRGGLPGVEVSARYKADGPAQAIVTLVTTKARFQRDLNAFKFLAGTAHPCVAEWNDRSGRSFAMGTGDPCPAEGKFF